ncbi:hypothetical protein EV1_035499 [Malus domestica]
MSRLQADVGRLEPRVVLDGGINGMDDLLHLCKGAAFMLKPGGFLAFESYNCMSHCLPAKTISFMSTF